MKSYKDILNDLEKLKVSMREEIKFAKALAIPWETKTSVIEAVNIVKKFLNNNDLPVEVDTDLENIFFDNGSEESYISEAHWLISSDFFDCIFLVADKQKEVAKIINRKDKEWSIGELREYYLTKLSGENCSSNNELETIKSDIELLKMAVAEATGSYCKSLHEMDSYYLLCLQLGINQKVVTDIHMMAGMVYDTNRENNVECHKLLPLLYETIRTINPMLSDYAVKSIVRAYIISEHAEDYKEWENIFEEEFRDYNCE